MTEEKKKKWPLVKGYNDGVYRHASVLEILFGTANSGNGICFYMLMMYASYIATEGYGIAVATMGIIATACRLFDGVTDPIVGAMFDRFQPKKGKIRIFLILGWIIEACCAFALYSWCASKLSGVTGLVVFVLIYIIYFIGYTINNIAGGVVTMVITNDPVQRPMMNLVSTCYSYITPMILTTVVSFSILPKYDNQYNAPMLREACYIYALLGLAFVVLACIFLKDVDTIENFDRSGAAKKGEKIRLKDMWSVLKDNRALQMFTIGTASDKIASTTASQTIVATMLSGILIGSYKATTIVGNVSMIIGISFLFIAGIHTGRVGAKKANIVWNWISIIITGIMVVFCWYCYNFLPNKMLALGVMGVPLMIYVVLSCIKNGAGMAVTTITAVMGADVADYELERSGKYMPGLVANIKSLIDKFVSAFGNALAAVMITFIGYKNTVPQMGDPATPALFWMCMFLSFGLPILGWICTLVAMHWYDLTKDRMAEVQQNIAKHKEAAKSE